mgnify:CR=1 FL=1
MSELISGKDALIALASGKEVQWEIGNDFLDITDEWQIREFLHPSFKFRLKPRTITINGVEVPAPFEPKCGDMVWCLSELTPSGYEARTAYEPEDFFSNLGYWRTEEEIKQIVAALRSIFKGGCYESQS